MFEALFSAPILAAAFLCLNGAVLLAAERLTQCQRHDQAQRPASVGAQAVAWARPLPQGIRIAAPKQVFAGIGGIGGTLGGTASRAGARTRPDTQLDMRRNSAPAGHVAPAERTLGEMHFWQAALIGGAQAFALFPGISRSGVTMVAGLASGLSHEAAARFSFLLATPIILAAGLLEIPQLFTAGAQTLVLAGVGGVVSGIAAFLSVRFLMR